MSIRWLSNTYCWIGLAKASYPRFEAWRSDEPVDDRWCLDMTQAPDLKPIKVRGLESLVDAQKIAEGLLAEFECVNDGSLPDIIRRQSREMEMAGATSARPRLRIADILAALHIRGIGKRYDCRTDKA